MKKKLYVGCAINNLSGDLKASFLKSVSDIKDTLRNHFDVLDFVGDAKASAEFIYNRDIKECVMTADFMLAICDHPSTGLGYEMATAIEHRKIPVLALAHKDSSVSRLILGIQSDNFTFKRYSSMDEIAPMTISTFLSVKSDPSLIPRTLAK